MKKFFSEFKDFIDKGNVMGLAIGVVIGGSFNAIVKSLVEDIIMPLIALIFGGEITFDSLAIWGITYGKFISAVVNFLVIALFLFIIMRAWNKALDAMKTLEGKAEEEKPEEPVVSETDLLNEILVELKKQNSNIKE